MTNRSTFLLPLPLEDDLLVLGQESMLAQIGRLRLVRVWRTAHLAIKDLECPWTAAGTVLDILFNHSFTPKTLRSCAGFPVEILMVTINRRRAMDAPGIATTEYREGATTAPRFEVFT